MDEMIFFKGEVLLKGGMSKKYDKGDWSSGMIPV
jgi:hypothetical protein